MGQPIYTQPSQAQFGPSSNLTVDFFFFFFFYSHPAMGWDYFLNVSLLTKGCWLAHNEMDNLPHRKKEALEVKAMKSRLSM